MKSVLINLSSFYLIVTATNIVYKTKRAEILETEALQAVGGGTQLTDKEDAINNCLMRYKFNEVDYAFDNPRYFNFSHHYFHYKDQIQHSKVYQIIKKMPKGAALHVHDMALMGSDYLLNITYMDQLYVCFEKENIQLQFSNRTPNKTCASNWELMRNTRASSKNVKEFDSQLKKHFTIVVNDPDKMYPSITDTWSVFMQYFITVVPMLSYRPVWEQYFYDALNRFRNDSIMYVEVRSILPQLYELDGTTYDPVVTMKAYKKSVTRFKKDYPDFVGAKVIYAPSRKVNREQLDKYIAIAYRLKHEVPDIFAGFDLVGQEDLGSPLIEFVPQLSAHSKDINYYFHAGETDWYGTETDDNIVDAILLGAKRLGHAYALTKHPLLMEEVKKRDIGIEVNVISNAVLSLVRDVRNHPLAVFLAQGMPVVISSDDPGVWDADPLSHDLYVAFVGVASKMSDLRLIKTLALNSIKYSSLNATEKALAFHQFDVEWQRFVDNFKCFDIKVTAV